MRSLSSDAVVIGSGFGGSVVSRRLQEAGFQVTVVEKGPRIDPSVDFKQTQDPKYLMKYIHGVGNKHMSFTYAEALGGGSGFYEMVSLRAPSSAFDQRDPKTGRRLWPTGIDRESMNTYYALSEEQISATQIEWAEVPRTGQVFGELMRRAGHTVDRVSHAQRGCIGSGYCITGCIYGAKQSMLVTYLPKAEEAGTLVLTDMNVIGIQQSNDPDWKFETICKDRNSGVELLLRSRIVVLAGGTIGTAALLQRSSDQLPLLSKHVGKNIASAGMVKAVAFTPDNMPDADMYRGRAHSGLISYDFLESDGITISSGKPLPLFIPLNGHLSIESRLSTSEYWGKDHVDLMKKIRTRGIVLYSIGMMPPSGSIRADGEDITVDHGDLSMLRSYKNRVQGILQDIFERTGCQPLKLREVDDTGVELTDVHFGTTHMTGSCRMADTIEHGVCDANGEVFNYPGLFIADSSALPSSLSVNPSLTILANAERIVPILLRSLMKEVRMARSSTRMDRDHD